MLFQILISGFVFIFLVSDASAQQGKSGHTDTLRKIRDEIVGFEKEIEKNKKKENSVLYTLSALDLDIDLAKSLIHRVKKERKQTETQIKEIEKNLVETDKELFFLKKQLHQRMLYAYKYGRTKDAELLLSARSLNEGLLWVEYQRRLAKHDFRNFLRIKEKEQEIARDRDLLALELDKNKKLLVEKVAKEKKLKLTKKRRQKVLAEIRQDMNLLREQVAEKESSAREIERMIIKMTRAPRRVPMPKPETLFAQLKGKMIWPTEGKVVTKFGRYQHPELKTYTENIGVDISATLNSAVHAVAKGEVTMITWQRGLGNIVIVSHYGGYYSVYAHLGEIMVNLSEAVEMGQEIGNVGESGSLKGPILHFEIWEGAEKMNPENWLGKAS